jgi:hypothetical protein
MRYSLLLAVLLSASTAFAVEEVQVEDLRAINVPTNIDMGYPNESNLGHAAPEGLLTKDIDLHISVIGQGVAPMNTISPAQAYALAKRAAMADGYRIIAEKVKGVRVDGQDTIRNMMVKRSTVRTAVNAMIKYANVVETTFKDGLCEVEMEIVLSHDQFIQ